MRISCIDILRDLPGERFFDQYFARKPFVIRDKISHWPATRYWTPGYLARHYGDAIIPVVLYDPEAGSFLDQTLADVHENMLLRDYLDALDFGDRRFAVREDSTLFKLFPQLLDELEYFSPFCSGTSISDTNNYKALWVGPANYLTGLHTDPGETLLFQLYGRKNVLLFDPEQAEVLYEEKTEQLHRKFERGALQSRLDPNELTVLRDNVRWCQVDPFNPDRVRFPLVDLAEGIEACICPGDTLYIPDQWWHAVRSLDATISVSIEPSLDGPFFARAR